jgi:hypothetical protein
MNTLKPNTQRTMIRFILIFSPCICWFNLQTVQAQEADTIPETSEEINELWTQNITHILVGGQLAPYSFLEIGIHRTTITEAALSLGSALSVESNLRKDNFILAPKIQCWMMFNFIQANLGMVYYTSRNSENSLKFRPEIGFGLWFGKITYGYNMSITNKNMPGVSKHNLCLNVLLGT